MKRDDAVYLGYILDTAEKIQRGNTCSSFSVENRQDFGLRVT